MQEYTGREYMLIDIATTFGLDKMLFPERIKWALENQDKWDELAAEAEEQPLYVAAVQAYRKAAMGIPTGHMMSLDAICSGTQIMSALTGCLKGATATGLIDPNVRSDAYSELTDTMSDYLDGLAVDVSRSDAKDAFMPFSYGSEAKPKEIFVEGTPAYNVFHKSVQTVAPGMYNLREILLHAWRDGQEEYTLVMDDGFHQVLRSTGDLDYRVAVDELGGATFTMHVKDFVPAKNNTTLVANPIHGIDGMLVREMGRRCCYDKGEITYRLNQLEEFCKDAKPTNYGLFLSVRQKDVINWDNLEGADFNLLCRLRDLFKMMLEHKPHPVLTNHDAFKASPNNMNNVRRWYIEMLAEIADSNILERLLMQIFGQKVTVNKLHPDLGSLIRKGEYALA